MAIRTRLLEPPGSARRGTRSASSRRAPLAHGYRLPGTKLTAKPIDLDDGSGVAPFRSVVTAAAGAGSMAGTSADLARWARALYTRRVLGPDGTALLLSGFRKTARYLPGVAYGYGVQAVSIDGHPTLGHSGRLLGFRSAVRHFPLDGLTIAVLTNQSRADPAAIVRALLTVALPPPPAPVAPPPGPSGSPASSGSPGASGLDCAGSHVPATGLTSPRSPGPNEGTGSGQDRWGMRRSSARRRLGSYLEGTGMPIRVEIYRPRESRPGVVARAGPLREILESGLDLLVERAAWLPLDGSPAPAARRDPPWPRTTSSWPSPRTPRTARSTPSGTTSSLDVGPYRVTGQMPTMPGFDPGRALARPTGEFVLLRDVRISPRRPSRRRRRGAARRPSSTATSSTGSRPT